MLASGNNKTVSQWSLQQHKRRSYKLISAKALLIGATPTVGIGNRKVSVVNKPLHALTPPSSRTTARMSARHYHCSQDFLTMRPTEFRNFSVATTVLSDTYSSRHGHRRTRIHASMNTYTQTRMNPHMDAMKFKDKGQTPGGDCEDGSGRAPPSTKPKRPNTEES